MTICYSLSTWIAGVCAIFKEILSSVNFCIKGFPSPHPDEFKSVINESQTWFLVKRSIFQKAEQPSTGKTLWRVMLRFHPCIREQERKKRRELCSVVSGDRFFFLCCCSSFMWVSQSNCRRREQEKSIKLNDNRTWWHWCSTFSPKKKGGD